MPHLVCTTWKPNWCSSRSSEAEEVGAAASDSSSEIVAHNWTECRLGDGCPGNPGEVILGLTHAYIIIDNHLGYIHV